MKELWRKVKGGSGVKEDYRVKQMSYKIPYGAYGVSTCIEKVG